MDWLSSLDATLFRFVNQRLSNPLLDWLLPFFSWNPLFVPMLILASIALIWKGGVRGRVFVALVLVVTAVGDGLICNALKHAINRPRPFTIFPEAHLLIGRGSSGSMPSAHTANWFAAATVAFFYFRRSLRLLLPLAGTIAFSRVYLGVHFVTDVLVGAALGIAYAIGIIWLLDRTWIFVGQRWFPLWWSKFPSLMPASSSAQPTRGSVADPSFRQPGSTGSKSLDQHWLHLGYVFIIALCAARLAYLASGAIELSEDEAYQWLWSKHLALSYFSKPPLIAYTQFLGTTLWGDNEFGIRFFSPVLAAILSFAAFRFLAREVNIRAAFWVLLMLTAAPLAGAGTILMTIDPLSVFFWSASVLSGWRALQNDSTRDWLWTGLWMGLGFLSKYIALFQLLCWGLFFIFWKPARKQLKRPGPYLALIICLLYTLPVLIWNHQHSWITVSHLAHRGGLTRQWHPTLRFFWDFLISEALLLNPIFFVGMVWAVLALLKTRSRDVLSVYLLSMGAPLFLFYLLYTVRARVQPNWIAPSILPLFCVTAIYWESRWRNGSQVIKRWAIFGLVLGATVVVLLHNTDLIQKVTTLPLPRDKDPLRRVRGWRELAKVVGSERTKLLQEGQPVFIIGHHYGITGLLSFYLPEAKASVSKEPLVYYESSEVPENQFYFWPSYDTRKGQNALFIRENVVPGPAPDRLRQEFESVSDLGIHNIQYRGRVLHKIQIFQCRHLR